MLRYLPFLLLLAVWIYAFIDCLNTPEDEVRKLPKVAWVIIILLFGQVLLGPVAWFWVGRPRRERNRPYGTTRPGQRDWVAPDDNPEFLQSLGKMTSGTSGTGPDAVGDTDTTAPREGRPKDTGTGQHTPTTADGTPNPDAPPRGHRDDAEGAGRQRPEPTAGAPDTPGDGPAAGDTPADGDLDHPDRAGAERGHRRRNREDGADRDSGDANGTAGPGDAPAS